MSAFAFPTSPAVIGAMAIIQTQALGSDVASLTFSSIPSTYEHLVIIWSARGSDSGNPDLNLRANGDTGANYDREILVGVGAAPASAPSVGQTSIVTVGSMPGSTAAAGRAASGMILIPAYKRTTFDKAVTCIWSDIRATGSGNELVGVTAGVWLSTSAITSLTILASAGNILTGSVFSLYGISGT